jgi:hypothetical protein
MRIIQSFWSKPLNKKENLNFMDRAKGGWLFEKIYYMSTALSCLKLKKFYEDVTLVTDKFGKQILIDILGLPYSDVIVELDNLNHYPEDLWALGKIYAYSIQNAPFLHVDSDIFIWKPFNEELLKKDLIFQSFETPIYSYKKVCSHVINNKFIIPPEMENYLECNGTLGDYSAINAGILGGNNIPFFKDYTKKAFDLVNMNHNCINEIDKGLFNIFYEQCLFYCLALSKRLTMGSLFDTLSMDYHEVSRICMVPHVDFIHLVGLCKKQIEYNESIYYRLLSDYPEYFNKIESIYN